MYRITGNFGGGFNFTIGRLKSLSPNFRFANNILYQAASQRVMYERVNARDYTCTCMQCRRERKRAMALYIFFQWKEGPVVPTLSMCGACFLSMKELERAHDNASRVLSPGEGESAKLTPRAHYNDYTAKERAEIGKYAAEIDGSIVDE